MSYHSSGARVVDGHVVRDYTSFSVKRLLAVAVLATVFIVTNPANELYDSALKIFDNIQGRETARSRQQELSEWSWKNIMNPPISVTNYGLFAVEEQDAKVEILVLTQSVPCPYFDNRKGYFCSALARNVCHGRPLFHDPKDYAYTAHRTCCLLLIVAALLSFCYGGSFPANLATEPLLGAILNSFGRNHFSLFSLGLDLYNCGMFVYPALARMERIVPTLQEGTVASALGLPAYADLIFYTVVLTVFLGGGCNSLASYFGKAPCRGFDSTVAAAVGYCSAFSSPLSQENRFFSPQTVLWSYLPVTAVLGGSALAWIFAGMSGIMLAQYHLDNQDFFLAIKQAVFSAFR